MNWGLGQAGVTPTAVCDHDHWPTSALLPVIVYCQSLDQWTRARSLLIIIFWFTIFNCVRSAWWQVQVDLAGTTPRDQRMGSAGLYHLISSQDIGEWWTPGPEHLHTFKCRHEISFETFSISHDFTPTRPLARLAAHCVLFHMRTRDTCWDTDTLPVTSQLRHRTSSSSDHPLIAVKQGIAEPWASKVLRFLRIYGQMLLDLWHWNCRNGQGNFGHTGQSVCSSFAYQHLSCISSQEVLQFVVTSYELGWDTSWVQRT